MSGIDIPDSRDYEVRNNPILGCFLIFIVISVLIGVISLGHLADEPSVRNKPSPVLVVPPEDSKEPPEPQWEFEQPENPAPPVTTAPPVNSVPPVAVRQPVNTAPATLPTPVQTKLGTPAVTVSVNGSNAIRVTWNSVNNASGYVVQCATNQSFTPILRTVSSSTTSADITGLNPDTTYFVRVIATGTGRYSNSDHSTIRSVAIAKLRPVAPTLGTVATVGTDGMVATWNSVNNASSYRVQFATNSRFEPVLRTVDSSTTSTNITGLNPSTTYHVRVMALGTGGNSDYSTVRSATTAQLSLGTPTITVAQASGSNSIRVTWNQVNNANNYRVQYATNATFTGARTVNSSTTSANITGLNPNTTYHVRVMARGTDSVSDSNYSASAMARTAQANQNRRTADGRILRGAYEAGRPFIPSDVRRFLP